MHSNGASFDPSGAPVASIIIPLRASPSLHQWEERLSRILAAIPRGLFELLVVDYGTAGPARDALVTIVTDASDVRLVRVDCEASPFAIGKARDIGVVEARAPVVLFNDIDFIAPRQMYEAIASEIIRRRLARAFDQFFCVPVVFLTEAATREYLEAPPRPDSAGRDADFRRKALREGSGTSVSIAYASSCMVANRQHYLALGGHDERFVGHGAEDFEFLHRVAATIPKAPRPPLYYVDFKDNGIAAYRGFRAAFALYGIEAFQAGLFLVHLHHPARPLKRYNRKRKENFRLLRERMQRFDRTGEHPPPLPDPGVAPSPVFFERTAAALPLTSALFQSFGGAPGMERALRQAADEAAGGSANLKWPASLALTAYRWAVSWKLSRRDRILLRHVPEEYLARSGGKPAGLLLRLLRSGRGE